MSEQTTGPTQEELRGNSPGKLRQESPAGMDLKGRELCRPGPYEGACAKLENPGLDGVEGFYQKRNRKTD